MIIENKHKHVFSDYKDLLYSYFKKIAPKNILERQNDRNIFQLEGDIYFDSNYFSGGSDFKEKIFNKIKNHQNEINYNTAYSLFEYLVKHVFRRIKDRINNIDDYLNKYLTDEDFEESFERIKGKLEESFAVYEFIFVTNYIIYECSEILDLEKIKIGKLNSAKESIPENIDYPYSAILAKLLSAGHYLERNEFLEKYGENTFIKIEIEGYHFFDEKSVIFNSCFYELKQILSFLFSLKELQSIKDWDIKSKEIDYNEVMYIYSYVLNRKGDHLKYIEHNIGNISNLKEKIMLNEKSINKIIDVGLIKKYIKCVINEEYGRLSEKYKRSLDWYFKSLLEENITDETISLFISLESLLSTDPDQSISFSNSLAENLVLLSYPKDSELRYKEKQEFKKEVYPLRNKIMHHGYTLSSDEDLKSLSKLHLYSLLSIYSYLIQVDKISKIGCKAKHLQKYFDLKKFE
jgi:hypothetical protein